MCHGSKMAMPALTITFVGQEFGVSKLEVGVLLTVYVVAMAASSVPAGLLSDRFGPGRVLAGFFWTLGVAALGCSQAQSYQFMLVVHGLLGLAAGLFHPAGLGLLSLSTEPARMGKAMGLFGVIGGIGWLSAPLMMGTSFGWRAGYLSLSLASFAGAVACHVLMRRGLVLPGPVARDETSRPSAEQIPRRWVLVVLLAAMGGNAFLLDGFLPLFSETIRDLGTWMVDQKLCISVVMGIGMVGQYVGGILARDVYASARYAVLLVLQPLTLLALAYSMDQPAWPYMLMGSFAFLNFMTQPMENKLLAAFTSAQRRSTAFALKFVVALLIAAPAGTLVGRLLDSPDWGYPSIYLLFASLGMPGVLAACLFLHGQRVGARRAA
jgi:FSR family fosmidomycin resistance protein-like MFS transporter